MILSGCSDIVFAGELSLNYTATGYETSGYSTSGRVSDSRGPIGFHAEAAYGEIDHVATIDRGEIGINYDPAITERWSLWLDETVGYNRIAGIRFENMMGCGPKIYLMKNEDRKLSFSTGVLYHLKDTNAKGSGRYSHRIKYKDRRSSFVYFYQPNIDNSQDYLVKSSIKFKLTKFISAFYNDSYRSLENLKEIEQGIRLEVKY